MSVGATGGPGQAGGAAYRAGISISGPDPGTSVPAALLPLPADRGGEASVAGPPEGRRAAGGKPETGIIAMAFSPLPVIVGRLVVLRIEPDDEGDRRDVRRREDQSCQYHAGLTGYIGEPMSCVCFHGRFFPVVRFRHLLVTPALCAFHWEDTVTCITFAKFFSKNRDFFWIGGKPRNSGKKEARRMGRARAAAFAGRVRLRPNFKGGFLPRPPLSPQTAAVYVTGIT